MALVVMQKSGTEKRNILHNSINGGEALPSIHKINSS